MKKKITTNQYIDSIFGILIFGVIILFFVSCSTSVVLPGLCYNDKDGTYICPKDYEEEPVNRDMEELQPIYDECAEWESHSGEAWMQCIMNEERRRQLLDQVKNTA